MGNFFLELQKITLRLHILRCRQQGLAIDDQRKFSLKLFIKTCNCLVNKIMQINEDPI